MMYNIDVSRVPKITPKQRKFVKNYVKTGNLARSVISAGYNTTDIVTASAIGNENLKKPIVKEEYHRVLDKAGLTDTAIANDLRTAINKGIESDKATVDTALRGLEIALRLKDKFPSQRLDINKKSINLTLHGKSPEELEEEYNRLLNEAQQFKLTRDGETID